MSAFSAPSLTIGIEEEYLLVDPETRDLAADPPAGLMEECEKELGGRVTPEFLRAQIEIGTAVCKNIKQARAELTELRTCVSRVAKNHGLRLMAASTHPFAEWEKQHHTAKERYDNLVKDMAGAIRRMLICGMHVHACIEDEDLRIDLMNQISYFLPHLLALSTSSPFWAGQNMGIKSCRLTVFDGMPRTGVPDRFSSFAEYDRLIQEMVECGALEDSSKLWWDVRPSARFPTLEMRITDVCTRMEDALTIAAIYQCLLRMLYRLRKRNQRWRIYPRTLVMENRWLAQRRSCAGEMIDFGHRQMSPFGDLLDDILDLIHEDADALGCVAEVQHAREIVRRGSSADRQIAVYQKAMDEGADSREALVKVVDHLLEETVHGLPDA